MNVELEAIIKNAITQGELSYEFYVQMADLATIQETKETFALLAKVEMEHNHSLQSHLQPEKAVGAENIAWIEEDSLKLLGMMEPKVGPTLHSGGIFIDDVSSLSPKESLLAAMKREEGSYRLYQTLAAQQRPGKPRSILEKLSQMKLGLKERLEDLYNNAAFVEVW